MFYGTHFYCYGNNFNSDYYFIFVYILIKYYFSDHFIFNYNGVLQQINQSKFLENQGCIKKILYYFKDINKH